MYKKVLVVDDSALMRRVICDIIDSDERFRVVSRATNGMEALELLRRNKYDAVILDVNMPKMNGLELLENLGKEKIETKAIMASTDTKEGAKVTLDALELGAVDFIHKPDNVNDCRADSFKSKLINILLAVTESEHIPQYGKTKPKEDDFTNKVIEMARKHTASVKSSKIIAIASSTGGPKALQSVIPKFPADIDAPIVLVQHMPKGFTASLAERLDEMSKVKVKEAEEGDILAKGCVYLARGGKHMNIIRNGSSCMIHYTDEPNREGVKPCANYMYESLANCDFDCTVCVVMTGMGADGTEGIRNLKNKKKVYVISQDQESCTVYGMPKSIAQAKLSDQVVGLEQIAQEIILQVGVTK
ncbi:MAG: chemotaxis response regulator protein-glutamate methylesterase [Lachnospiraceae bacterium]|nr:chemotaxis response regulator protein-glutamate methylesterase [Lachnospiraceae bacterium]